MYQSDESDFKLKHAILDFILAENPKFSDELYIQAKRCLIDTLGVAIAARNTEVSRVLKVEPPFTAQGLLIA